MTKEELEATERQVEILSDDLSKCSNALKLALEALESKYIVNGFRLRVQQDQAITAIREVLAQPAPQRTWVGLTDEDKQTAFDETQEGGGFWEFADAIEAKLKEKNT